MGLGKPQGMRRAAHPVGVDLRVVLALVDQPDLHAVLAQGHGDRRHKGAEGHPQLHRQAPDGIQGGVAVSLLEA
jgi:hypothetical protein